MALVETAGRSPGLSRRQALRVAAAVAGVPLAIGAARLLAPAPEFHTWAGTALGGDASLSLWHTDAAFAQRTIARMVSEVGRLEDVFSLFRPESELSRLNRDGALAAATPDLRAVLEAATNVAVASGGAFDVTVQALWRAYERHFAATGADPAGPPANEIVAAVRLVDYEAIEMAGRRVRLALPGAAVTLNGIAQGYITDRIADLLRNEGFDHVIVELGETRVLGDHPSGEPWRIGIRDRSGATAQALALSDQALSVSGGHGTVFEPSGRSHHIFDPDTGRSADGFTTVAVRAPRAMTADALSTAIVVAGEGRAPALLAAHPGASALVIRGDGTVWTG